MSAEVVYRIQWYRGGGVKVHGRKQSSWHDHLHYIATKPEADRGDAEAYRVGDGDYEIERGGAAWHVRYAALRPGSEGLFGSDGPADWRETAQALDQHDLPAWRVILSMREADAARWGMVGREKWAAAIEAAMPDVARAMRLDPERARWVAAYHAKPGQPHAHLVIWEEPHRSARCQGYLKGDEFRGVKRAFMRELAREERNRLTGEKTAVRDAVLELAQDNLRQAAAIVREIQTTAHLELEAMDGAEPGVAPILREGPEAELVRRLEALAAMLPDRGRVAYKFMPANVKAAADELADWLLGQPGFYDQAQRYGDLSRELAAHYSGQPQRQDDAARNAKGDLRRRVAQRVLRAAATLEREGRAQERGLAGRPLLKRCAQAAWRSAWAAVRREVTRAEARAALQRMRELEWQDERAAAKRAAEMGVMTR